LTDVESALAIAGWRCCICAAVAGWCGALAAACSAAVGRAVTPPVPPLRGVRRAPVVAASGDLVGIVSTDDLLGIIAEQLGSLAHLLDRQTRSAAR
jgi:CBS domain-containing protein